MFLASVSYGVSGGDVPASNGSEGCVFKSTVDPKTEMRWHLPSDPGVPIGLWQGVLVQGGRSKPSSPHRGLKGMAHLFGTMPIAVPGVNTCSRSLAPSRPTAWRLLQMWMAFSSLAWGPTFITAANARIEH